MLVICVVKSSAGASSERRRHKLLALSFLGEYKRSSFGGFLQPGLSIANSSYILNNPLVTQCLIETTGILVLQKI